MKLKHFFKKEDFKRFNECEKKFLLFKDLETFKFAKKLQKDKKIFIFFKEFEEYDALINQKSNFSGSESDFFQNFAFDGKREEGIEVGKLAWSYFKQKKKIINFAKDYNHLSFLQQIKLTKKIINFQEYKYELLIEPPFIYDNFVARCDFLSFNKKTKGWDLIEVKATTKIKKEHLADLSFQYYLLKKNNILISSIYLMHLNRSYKRDGKLNLKKLFYLEEFYKRKELITFLSKVKTITDDVVMERSFFHMKKLFFLNKTDIGHLFLNKNCFFWDKTNYCEHIFPFYNQKTKKSIFNLYRLRKKQKALFFYEHKCFYLNDIFKKTSLFEKLNAFQKRQILIFMKKAQIFNEKTIYQFEEKLNRYKIPLIFFDFETINFAIPKWKDSFPYQQIPFQYTAYVVGEKFKKQIFFYLHETDTDPRINLIKSLYELTIKFPLATFVSYNSSFEKKIILELIIFIKSTNYFTNTREIINSFQFIIEKMLDLLDFFKDGSFYHPDFNGSLSIKSVLPFFSPHLNYEDNLKIKTGVEANEFYRNFINKKISLKLWNNFLKKELLKYNEHDVLAMFSIFKQLIKLSKNFSHYKNKKYK